MKLLESFTLGKFTLRNRMVMAPMTRNRAEIDGEPNDLMAEYYRQRSTFGLIITEGTAPAHVGKAYPGIPGIYRESQGQRWAKVIDGVHDAGGMIFIQLMHSGRISHQAITGLTPLAPSAVLPAGEIFTGSSNEPFQRPAEMNSGDIEEAIESFCKSARLAIDSGADGVEIHAANGYLLHQFLSSNANLRSDQYGGKPENRARFAIEVVKRVTDAIGAERTGIRISPNGSFNDISETEIEQTYKLLLSELDSLGLAYLHVADQPGFDSIGFAREHFHGVLIANSGYHDKSKIETAIRLIEEGRADLFSFGRLALANPDLPRRIQENLELNRADSKTFYSRGPIGYTDYPEVSGDIETR